MGYDDDQILVDYLDMWKDLMDCDAEPDPDEYTQIQSLGQEAGPVVTGDAAMLNENNNYASKMSSANPNLKVTIPPVSDINKKRYGISLHICFASQKNQKLKRGS